MTQSSAWQLIALDKKWGTISNLFTVLRLFLTPVVVLSLYHRWWVGAFVAFVLAALTDVLDGYCARMLNEQTHLGTLLDPIADKFFLITSFGALAFLYSPLFPIPHWFFILIVCRELIILMGSLAFLHFFPDFKVKPLIWGKLTTFLQILFVMWIFICYFAGWEPKRTSMVLLGLLTGFSLLSLMQYIRHACVVAWGDKKVI